MLNIVGNYSRSSPRCESRAGGWPNRDRTVANDPDETASYHHKGNQVQQTAPKVNIPGAGPAVRSSGRAVGGLPRTDTVGAP